MESVKPKGKRLSNKKKKHSMVHGAMRSSCISRLVKIQHLQNKMTQNYYQYFLESFFSLVVAKGLHDGILLMNSRLVYLFLQT